MSTFDQILADYGAVPENLVRFDSDCAELLPYATLAAARQIEGNELGALQAVYEWQGSPLVFLVDETSISSRIQLQLIRRRLALRGDAPYLGVVGTGQLTLYRLGLDALTPAGSRLAESDLPTSVALTFSCLANQRPGLGKHQTAKHRWVADVLLKLLGDAIDALIDRAEIEESNAISLVGRALFARFLADRKLLPTELLEKYRADSLFDTYESAEAASDWLDATFNGDLLPYSEGLWRRLPEAAFKELGNIARVTPGGQYFLEWQEDWAHLDFAYIPVGVLSQAYEHHQRRHTQERQKREGGFYTPRPLAELLVRGAFHALRSEGRAHCAKVLDPAAGAGVFLLTAFRQLVGERWRQDGRRPNTPILREILYGQLAGFDINEGGLRFAALGLYLLSIELDPHPQPVQKLAFEKLRDRVLFKVGEEGGLGSLGAAVGDEHLGHYDLVMGNPPWASATKLVDWRLVKEHVARIAATRLPVDGPKPRLPNEVLDLPFVWRAMEWVRPGGQIAFALHGRLLFQQGDGMQEERAALFQALDVTGVINGAALRNSKVWPEIAAPFCLLFARNERPGPDATFRYVSPRLEQGLNDNGQLRLDVDHADTLNWQQVARRPEIFKLLFRGGSLGVELFDRLAARKTYRFAETIFAQRLIHGNGYQKCGLSSRPRVGGDGLPGVSANYLRDILEIKPSNTKSLLISATDLKPFVEERIHDPRPRELFLGPLLIVHESLLENLKRIHVLLSEMGGIFSKSYHGYGVNGHQNGTQLMHYMALTISSKPALWYVLVTSGKFGVEREVVEKNIIDSIPLPPLEDLSDEDKARIEPLFSAVAQRNDEAAWQEVDAWVAKLYGLRPRDLEVIADTLRFELPFAANRKAAQQPPTKEEREIFRSTLETELQPWARRVGRALRVALVDVPREASWSLLHLDTQPELNTVPGDDWARVLHLADQLAQSEVMLLEPGGQLWLARLNQARYWSRTAARLAARRIVWKHADQLFAANAA